MDRDTLKDPSVCSRGVRSLAHGGHNAILLTDVSNYGRVAAALSRR